MRSCKGDCSLCMLKDFRMVSNGRDSAEQARNRQTLARGYETMDPGFMVVQGGRYGDVVCDGMLRQLGGGMHRRHAAVKPRPP